ncbi:MAG: tetratricopeptide repeat protein, partial [Candidatus Scalindua sp.]
MFFKVHKRYGYFFAILLLIGMVIGCDNAQDHIELADKHILDDKPDKAIEEYKQALDLDKNIAEVHYKLGDIYIKKKMLEEAAKEFRKAIEIRPDYNEANLKLSETYNKIGV